MKLKKRTKKIFRGAVIVLVIIGLLLPLTANFIPQKQSEEIDPKLLEAYINSQNESVSDKENIIELPDIEGTYQVVDISSGNTITIMWGDEERDVKLIGVKEVSASKEVLKEKLKNDFVQLEFDVEDEDENGKLLAYAYDMDGTFINYDLILHGNARMDTKSSENKKYDTEFRSAQIAAKNNQVGCWAENDIEKEVK